MLVPSRFAEKLDTFTLLDQPNLMKEAQPAKPIHNVVALCQEVHRAQSAVGELSHVMRWHAMGGMDRFEAPPCCWIRAVAEYGQRFATLEHQEAERRLIRLSEPDPQCCVDCLDGVSQVRTSGKRLMVSPGVLWIILGLGAAGQGTGLQVCRLVAIEVIEFVSFEVRTAGCPEGIREVC